MPGEKTAAPLEDALLFPLGINLDEIGRAPLPRCVLVVQGRKPHAFPRSTRTKSVQFAGRAENEMRLTFLVRYRCWNDVQIRAAIQCCATV